MIESNRAQIDAIRFSDTLQSLVASCLDDPGLASKISCDLSNDEYINLDDACHDALINHAPVLEEFYAEQDKGVYGISISGVPGAYVVFAPEIDDAGIFSTLDEAHAHVYATHGEFLVDPEAVDEDNSDESGVEEFDPFAPRFSDTLLTIFASSEKEEDIETMRRRILADKTWIRLANGEIAVAGPLPVGIRAVLKDFETTLQKPMGFVSGMGQQIGMSRLAGRAVLFFLLNGHLPTRKELSELYNL